MLGFTRAVLSHGEDVVKVQSLDPEDRSSSFTEEVKIGYIKFQNGSRIIAFSSNPYAMAVYGGDVGLDEFAKHPNAHLLWQTAQARVTWGYDLAVWSSHDGEDTLFNQFAQQARAACTARVPLSSSASSSSSSSSSTTPGVPAGEPGGLRTLDSGPRTLDLRPETPDYSSTIPSFQNSIIPTSPWNLYFRVTLSDAIELGLLEVINRTRDASFNPEQFVADCCARAGSEEIF